MIKPHILQYLDDHGVRWRAERHPPRVTAQEIAAVEHVSGKRFAKTVVVAKDGELLLVAIPADEEVDLGRLTAALGGIVRLADEAEFEGRFRDCELGAMPPLGELYGMELVVDAHLTRQPSIVFNAGTHEDTLEVSWDDFRRLGSARVVECGRPAGPGATRPRAA